MGGIWFRGREFVPALSEIVGYKSGLALSAEQLHQIVESLGLGGYWPDEKDTWYRIRSEAYEELFAGVLGHLGVGPPRRVFSPLGDVYHRAKRDPELRAAYDALVPIYVEWLGSVTASVKPGDTVDPRPFMIEAEEYGEPGRRIGIDLLESTNASLEQSPWGGIRRVEWKDVRELDDLFLSEKLESAHGEYFDQRFADFLAVNFDDVDKINWRQFEGLAAEFFSRVGFQIELGPGRGDGGVDIRLWPADSALALPPTVLVQCKREKRRVTSTIVKALWADVEHEQAASGLIVTTSSFSPSAREVRTARGYSVREADPETLRRWIEAMRTPGAGVLLGE